MIKHSSRSLLHHSVPSDASPRVAVIGAGLAGLSLARRLLEQGARPVVFEKNTEPGGRMASWHLPSAGSVDLGAQHFTIRNPEFRSFLENYAPGAWCLWPGRFWYQAAGGDWQPMRESERYAGFPEMGAIARQLAAGPELRTGVCVDRVCPGNSRRWRLELAGKASGCGEFDAVFLAIPPARARWLLSNSGLAALTTGPALRDARMMACQVTAVHFPQGAGARGDAFMPSSDVLHWAANNSGKPGRGGAGEWWVLHGEPDWSDAHIDMEPAEAVAALLAAFRSACGIEAPHGETRHYRWRHARPEETVSAGHLWFAEQGIGIAGDWLHGGRVEGAFNSAESLIRAWRQSRLSAPG